MQNSNRTAFEVVFGRCWEARFMSHLDVMRALSRTLRRSGLPIYFTEGFNPRPKVSYLTMPLSPGHTSECEKMELQLVAPVETPEVRAALESAVPPGFRLENIDIAPVPRPKASGYLYYVFFTESNPGALNSEGENAGAAGDTEKFNYRPLDAAAMKRARIALDGAAGTELIGTAFRAAASFVVPAGDAYEKPASVAARLTVAAPAHYHRKEELVTVHAR